MDRLPSSRPGLTTDNLCDTLYHWHKRIYLPTYHWQFRGILVPYRIPLQHKIWAVRPNEKDCQEEPSRLLEV